MADTERKLVVGARAKVIEASSAEDMEQQINDFMETCDGVMEKQSSLVLNRRYVFIVPTPAVGWKCILTYDIFEGEN